MISRSKSRGALKALLARRPERLTGATLDLNKETNDRAVALVGSAILEHSLQRALLAFFIPLDVAEQNRLFDGAGNGPLVSFAAKVSIGFALGVFGSQTRDDLGHMRDIRNVFAHATEPVTFETPEVAATCESIAFMATDHDVEDLTPRLRFMVTLSFFVNSLGLIADVRRGRSLLKAGLKVELP